MPEAHATPPALPAPAGGCPDLLVVAGEHSGDEHAARMVAGLLERRPDLRVAALGGPKLAAAGAQLLFDMTSVAVVGFAEVVRHLGFFKALMAETVSWIGRHRPRHLCLVDYPGFNLRLAKALRAGGLSRKGGGRVAISYYISPQVWAWKKGRRFRMAETLDRLGVIFPFEVECFADTSLPVEFVGHPFVEPGFTPPFLHDAGAPVLLLPGSRSAAVGRIFPVLLRSLELALKEEPGLRARAVYPGAEIRACLEDLIAERPGLAGAVELVPNTGLRSPASAVLMSSGTMSLACALSGLPGAIVYRLNPFSYWLGRVLVDVPYIGIANLLLDRPLHPEFIQGAARPQRLAAQLRRAARDPQAARAAAEGAAELRSLLRPGEGGGAADWLRRGLEEPPQ
jgi:lipid-A-disaccharide synthase